MAHPKETAPSEAPLREITTWSRRYAQNRGLPVLTFLNIFGAVFGALVVATGMASRLYLTGHRAFGVPAGALLVLLLALGTWPLLRRDRFLRWINNLFYRKEGQATLHAGSPRRWDTAISLTFFAILLTATALGVGTYPSRYMQPLSALYTIPFLVYLG